MYPISTNAADKGNVLTGDNEKLDRMSYVHVHLIYSYCPLSFMKLKVRPFIDFRVILQTIPDGRTDGQVAEYFVFVRTHGPGTIVVYKRLN